MRNTRMRHGRTNGIMHVRTLGRAELSASGTRLGPEAPVSFSLLLHLVLERDRWVARTQLQEMLFPQQDRVHARHSLRQSVYTLRKDGFPIEGSGPAVHISAKAIVDDYSTLLTPQLEGERELSDLMGGWLAGFEPTISPTYSHWFEGKRSEIALRMRTALLAELAVHKRNARWAQCERTCRAILSLDPLNEEATLGLAEALALTGAKVQAIRILERYQEEMPNADLQLPARILKRRISEHLPNGVAPRRDPAFVGRGAEMRTVSDLIDTGKAGSAAGMLITGEPGIGKTRILREAEAIAAIAGFQTLHHGCLPHDATRPLGVIANIAPRLRQLPGSLGCAPEALSIVGRLETFPRTGSTHQLFAADSQDLAALMGWAITELVSAVIAEGPLLLCIDDAQWADEASLMTLAKTLESLTGPLVVLLSARHTPQVLRSNAGRSFRQLPIKSLCREDANTLLAIEVGERNGEQSAAFKWAETTAGGNPLFIVSLARHAKAHPDSRAIPNELALLLDHRLRDLNPTESLVLNAVCALGRHATFARLDRVLALPRHELIVALDNLDSEGFSVSSGDALSATHPLIADRALQRTTDSARKYLYHAAASVLQEDAVSSDDPALLWDVISLVKRSGASRQLIGVARQCAQHALSIGRAVDACDILLDARDNLMSADDLNSLTEDLLTAAISAGRWKLVSECVTRLESCLANSCFSPSQLQWFTTEAEWHRGHHHQDLRGQLQERMSDEALPHPTRLKIADLLCIVGSNMGDERVAKQASHFASGYLAATPGSPDALCILLVYEATFGDMQKAKEHAVCILEATEGKLPTQTTLRLRNNAATCLRFAGQGSASRIHLERAYHDALRYGFVTNAYGFAHEMAFASLTTGDLSTSRTWISEAEELKAISGDHVDPYGLAEAKALHSLLHGDAASAVAHVADLESLSKPRSQRLRSFAEALTWLAKYLADGDVPPADAMSHLLTEFQSVRGILEADFFAWALYRLMLALGETEAARNLVHEYVTKFRRDQSPVPPHLATALLIASNDEDQSPGLP